MANRTTAEILDHHTQAFSEGNVEELLSDYSEESVMYTSGGPYRGLAELRKFFVSFLASVPSTFVAEYTILRKDIEGDLAYTVWRSGTYAPLGTDTFIAKDGKFLIQTTAAYVAPK